MRSRRWLLRVNKGPILSWMGNRPPKIDFNVDDLALAKGQDLGVPKAPAAYAAPLVRDENPIAVRDAADEVEPFCSLAVGPAASEIRRAVNSVVERAGEMEVISDQRFERCSILRNVSLIAGPHDCEVGFAVHTLLRQRWIVRFGKRNVVTVGVDHHHCLDLAV
jgi:hypothetical protein